MIGERYKPLARYTPTRERACSRDHRAVTAARARHGVQREIGDGGLLERGLLAAAQRHVGRVGSQDDVDALRALLQLPRPGMNCIKTGLPGKLILIRRKGFC